MCRPRTITHPKCPSWLAILWTSNRTPANVKKKETEAMNMRRRGRSGIVVRTRNPSRVNCSSTSRTTTTKLAKASNKSAPVPGILLLNHLGALPRIAGCQNRVGTRWYWVGTSGTPGRREQGQNGGSRGLQAPEYRHIFVGL